MSTTRKTIPHANAFDVLRHTNGVVLTEFEISRIDTALQGAHALIAVLQRREIDSDIDYGDGGLSFDSNVAQGLLSALATCVQYTSDVVGHGGTMGQRADCGEPEYAAIEQARLNILNTKRRQATKEARHE